MGNFINLLEKIKYLLIIINIQLILSINMIKIINKRMNKFLN